MNSGMFGRKRSTTRCCIFILQGHNKITYWNNKTILNISFPLIFFRNEMNGLEKQNHFFPQDLHICGVSPPGLDFLDSNGHILVLALTLS